MLATVTLMQPRFSNVSMLRSDSGDTTTQTMPIQFTSNAATAIVRFTLHTPTLHPRLYRIIPDDCVIAMNINGEDIWGTHEPECDYINGFSMNIGPYLHAGANTFVIQLQNAGGPAALNMQVATGDSVFLITLLTLAIALSWLLYIVIRYLPGTSGTRTCAMIVCAALALRILYLFGTPYTMRAHDVSGHLEYISYLLQHWSLPSEGSGWQWYQPPLYYLALAPIFGIMQSLNFSDAVIYQTLQFPAFLSGIIVVALSMRLASIVFPKKSQSVSYYIFLSLIVFFPALVYTGARINNDVFVTLFGFGALTSLIAWWRGRPLQYWYIAVGLCGLALLSKSSALLLLPIVFGCPLLAKSLKKREKGLHISMGLLLLGMMTSWLFTMRFFTNLQPSFIGNIGSLNSGLRLTNAFTHLTRFDITQILGHIYNNAWDDAAGRQYFWEYLYRSAFFGEFSFPDSVSLLAMGIVLLGFVVLGIALYGAAISWLYRAYKDLPFLLIFVILLIGHLAFRMSFPFSSSQDMRYSILVIIPLAYFISLSIERVSRRWAIALTTVTVIFILLCTLFLASISIL